MICIGCAINIECTPILQNSDTAQNEPKRNPEYNPGLLGGDIVPEPPSIARGVGIKPISSNRWAGGVVPYVFASNISSSNVAFIETQMRAMENLTQVNNTQCIQFRPKTGSDVYFITIFNGSGCSAPVGNWGSYTGIRPVSLLDSSTGTCMVSGIVQHELTHVLGFFHEQSRPDRDTYVTINWANIASAQAFNFDKYNATEVDTQGTPYDYGSVMHYDRYAFAINSGIATITPVQNASAVLGQRIRLSPIDILEIQRYYGCVPTPSSTTAASTTAASTTAPVTVTAQSSSATSVTVTAQSSSVAPATVTAQRSSATPNAISLQFEIYMAYLVSIIYLMKEIY